MFAGRELTVNAEVYASESATNMRNQGIAHLLKSYERLYFDPDEATDVYTRQCSLDVTVHDLAVMAATLANGGVNPDTGETVIRPGVCRRVLAVMSSAGPVRAVGRLALPGRGPGQERRQRRHRHGRPRQGRAGHVLPSPGRRPGNSIRGQLATKYLAERLGLNLFASVPAEGSPPQF
jgi:glutaminase